MTDQTPGRSSRLPGFYKHSMIERAAITAQWADLSQQEQSVFFGLMGLSLNAADNMIENVIGVYSLPIGIATNFTINERDYLVPMVIEEPSVIAAVSNAAKAVRAGGGFTASSDPPVMIGQIQLLDVPDVWAAAEQIQAEKDALLEVANQVDRVIVKLGGGARDIETRPFPDTPAGPMLIVHVLADVRDAMGANAINTMCERLAPVLENLTGGRVNLRILSNLADQRTATAECRIPPEALNSEDDTGEEVITRILEAAAFAEVDPYRAATHNKGIMNGIDAVVIATGNDWRAVEAGAHTFAHRDGGYTSLSRWWRAEDGALAGALTLPMAVGIIGGATKVHPVAQAALKVLGVTSAQELARVLVCVGLGQNLAAIRALATDGIQRGHMSLHARQIAMSAGAEGQLINEVVNIMLAEDNIRLERAQELVAKLRGEG